MNPLSVKDIFNRRLLDGDSLWCELRNYNHAVHFTAQSWAIIKPALKDNQGSTSQTSDEFLTKILNFGFCILKARLVVMDMCLKI